MGNRKTASQMGKILTLAIGLVFFTAILAIFMMGPLTDFFMVFGYATTDTEVWDLFIPLLTFIVGPLLIIMIAMTLGMGTTNKQSLGRR